MQNSEAIERISLNLKKALEAVTRKGRRVFTNPATSNAFFFFKGGIGHGLR